MKFFLLKIGEEGRIRKKKVKYLDLSLEENFLQNSGRKRNYVIFGGRRRRGLNFKDHHKHQVTIIFNIHF